MWVAHFVLKNEKCARVLVCACAFNVYFRTMATSSSTSKTTTGPSVQPVPFSSTTSSNSDDDDDMPFASMPAELAPLFPSHSSDPPITGKRRSDHHPHDEDEPPARRAPPSATPVAPPVQRQPSARTTAARSREANHFQRLASGDSYAPPEGL